MSWQEGAALSQFFINANYAGGADAAAYSLVNLVMSADPVVTDIGDPYSSTGPSWSFAVVGPDGAIRNQRCNVIRPVRPLPIRRYSGVTPVAGQSWGPVAGASILYPGLPGFTCLGQGGPSGTSWFVEDSAYMANWAKVTADVGAGSGVSARPCLSAGGGTVYDGSVLPSITLSISLPLPTATGIGYPNVRQNAVIAYRMGPPGVFTALDACLDDPLGTIKIWPDDDIPAGWTEVLQGLMLAGDVISATQAREHQHGGGDVLCAFTEDTDALAAGATEKHLPPYKVVRWIMRTS